MIRLENLHGDTGARQTRKRIGRGESSGQGRTAGKGNKGGQARAGASKRKRFEGGQTPLSLRLPKRGFSHDAWRLKTSVVKLSQLGEFRSGTVVNAESLTEAGLVSSNAERIKVLGNGEVKKKLTVVADAFSASARQKIEAAGGTCETARTKR